MAILARFVKCIIPFRSTPISGPVWRRPALPGRATLRHVRRSTTNPNPIVLHSQAMAATAGVH
jgi:hypothetical protein